jgi:hypothetical protein
MLLKKEIPEGGAERSVVECCSTIKTNIAGDYELEIINNVFFYCHFLHRDFVFLSKHCFPRKGRGEEGPRGLSVDTDGVAD